MLKKYHVSEFIKDIMEEKKLKKVDLYKNISISRQQIENILNSKANINYETAILLSPILDVSAKLLMNLNLIYIEYEKNQEAKRVFKIDAKKIKFNRSNIENLNYEDYLFFKNNENIYINNMQLVHYQPAKSNVVKHWLLCNEVKTMGISNYEFDFDEFKSWIFTKYSQLVLKVNDKNSFIEFLKIVKDELFNLGISLKVNNTKLNTTIKAMTSITNKPKIFIEFDKDIPNFIFKLTHELFHIINKDNIKITEDEINRSVNDFLLGDLQGYLDININHIDTLLDKIEPPTITGLFFRKSWAYKNNRHQYFKNQMEVDENDILQLFV